MRLRQSGVLRQRLAVGDGQLQRDEVDAVDELGHGMLDLEPGVHLEEVELAVLAEQELDRAGAAVAATERGRHGHVAEPRAQLRVDGDRGRLLDQLLAAALDRALALAEGAHVAVRVGHDLHLDMPRGRDVALEEDRRVAEGGGRLRARDAHRILQLVNLLDDADAAPAAAGGCLDQQREADPLGLGARVFEVLRVDLFGAGDDGHAGGLHQPPRLHLVAHCAHCRGGRADEGDAGRLAGFGERGVLREEAVAGVHRVGARLYGCLDESSR